MRLVLLAASAILVLIAPAISATEVEIKKAGPITEKTGDAIVVQDVSFIFDDETCYEHGSESDLAVGVVVKVEGKYIEGVLHAREIEFSGEGEGEKIIAYGEITALGSDGLTVQGKTFLITDETEFEHGDQGDLAVGILVKVKGQLIEGQLVAYEIEIKGESEDDEVKTQGAVTAVDGDSFTVAGMTFLITDDTEFEHGSQSDLIVGAMVKVEGEKEGSTLYAEEVKFLDDDVDPDGKPEKVEVKGLVTAIGEDSFTVADKMFTVTPKTKFKNGTFAGMTVGDMVWAKGESTGDSLVAQYVKFLDGDEDDHGKGMTAGVLMAIAAGDGTTRLVLTLDGGLTCVTDAGLRVDGRHGLKSTAADLITGLTLRIQFRTGESAGETVREATNIWIVGYDKLRGKIDGASASAVLGSFTIEGEMVVYDHVSIVIGSKNGITDPAALPAGTRVEVLGNPVADGSLLANKIIVTAGGDDDEPGKCKDSGIVESVSSSEGTVSGFSLNNRTWVVNAATVFKVKGCSTPFEPADFIAGLMVKVVGVTDGTTCTATLVQISLPSLRFTGALEAVGDGSVTVLGQVLTVTPQTRLKDFPEGTTLADLAPGDIVEIKVFLWPDGSYVVEEIKPGDDDGELELKGLITAKSTSGDTLILEISGIPVLVTSETIVVGDIEDYIVGARVEIHAVIGEGGTIIALMIELDD